MKKVGAAVDLDPLHAATGRASLQNIATELLVDEMPGVLPGPAVHAFGVVESGTRRHKANILAVRNEPQGLPGNTQSDLEFRADGNPLDITAEVAGEKRVLLVPAIESNLFSEQAG